LWCKCRRQNGRATESWKDARSSSDAYPTPLGAWRRAPSCDSCGMHGRACPDRVPDALRGHVHRPRPGHTAHLGEAVTALRRRQEGRCRRLRMKGRGPRPLVKHGGRCLPGLRYAGHSEARFLDAIGNKKQHARKVLKVRISTENVTMSATPSSVERSRFDRTPVLGAPLIPAQTTTFTRPWHFTVIDERIRTLVVSYLSIFRSAEQNGPDAY
jgi:hypothetical protein